MVITCAETRRTCVLGDLQSITCVDKNDYLKSANAGNRLGASLVFRLVSEARYRDGSAHDGREEGQSPLRGLGTFI